MANIADFVTQNFRGPNLAQIDRARTVNALGNLDLQNEQMRQQTLLNPNATPDQMARFAPQTAQVMQQQQVFNEHQKATASAVLAQRYSAVARSADPVNAFGALVQGPEFQAAAKVLGFDPSQFALTPQDTPDSIRQGAIDHARALGVDPMAKEAYTLGANQQRYEGDRLVASGPTDTTREQALAETMRHNKAMEGGQTGVGLDPETLRTAAVVVASDPTRIRDYATYGKTGQLVRQQIAQTITGLKKETGMSDSDFVQARARAKAAAPNIAKLYQQSSQYLAAEQLARANGQRLLDLFDMVDQTGVPMIEGITRSVRAQSGGVDAAELKSVLTTFQTEVARIIASSPTMAGTISDSARNEVMTMAPGNMSTEQAKRVVNRLFTEMDIKNDAVKAQIGSAVGQTAVLGGQPPGALPQIVQPGQAPTAPPTGRQWVYDPATGQMQQR